MTALLPAALIVLAGALFVQSTDAAGGQFRMEGMTVMTAQEESMGGLAGNWVVTAMADAEIPKDARITMHFGNGQVWGIAACRSYNGSIDVAGNHFVLGEMERGHQECKTALMQTESRFMRAFEASNRFEIAPDGTLHLFAQEFPKVTARRADEG